MLKITALLMLLLLSACMIGPNYQEPAKNINDHWLIPTDSLKDIAITPNPPNNAAWWQLFNDPTLTALIDLGYHNNLSLQIAGVRVLQTRAQLAQAVGELYPQQQALMGNITYQRIGGSILQFVIPSQVETALLGFTASWEIDFWGKYRRAILSKDANFLASFAAYDNALVTLTADIASTYINVRTNEALIKITQENIQLQKISWQIASARFKAGQTSLLDVEQAQTELFETQSKLPSLLSQLQTEKDKLAVLLGATPDEMDCIIKKSHGIPYTTTKIEVGIPKETLAQRPDIHAARLKAIAQLESIGEKEAMLYPSFSLAGTFAFTANTIFNNSLLNLFNWSNRMVTANAAVNWPLLNYGQLTNLVRIQDAVFQQTLLRYLNLVLKAQQEVQDNITRYLEAKKTKKYLTISNASAIKSSQLALIRYKEGESDYTTVLDVERQQLRVQTSLIRATGDIPRALVALYRSLGGGWQIRCGNDIVTEQIKQQMADRTNWGTLLIPQNHLPAIDTWEQIKQLYLPVW